MTAATHQIPNRRRGNKPLSLALIKEKSSGEFIAGSRGPQYARILPTTIAVSVSDWLSPPYRLDDNSNLTDIGTVWVGRHSEYGAVNRTHEVAPLPGSDRVQSGSERAPRDISKSRKNTGFSGDTSGDTFSPNEFIPCLINRCESLG